MSNRVDDLKLPKLMEGEILQLDGSDVSEKWTVLDKVAAEYISVERGVRERKYIINELFDSFNNSQKKSEVDIYAEYTGDDTFGGSTELFCKRDDKSMNLLSIGFGKYSFLDEIKFEMTVTGLIEAFYVAMILPTKGVFWHGHAFIDDCSFILAKDLAYGDRSVREEDISEYHGKNWLDKLGIPLGIRIKREDMGYSVSCLALYVDSRIIDRSIKVLNGKAIQNEKQVILESNIRVIY